MTEQLTEQDAALLEGLAPMPADLIPLRAERLRIKKQMDTREQRMNEIRDIFGARLESDGLQGYVLDGKVKARRTHVTNTRPDAKKLKEMFPKVWAEVAKVTKSWRINID